MPHYLITYDIRDDKRRAKLAKVLEGMGTRIQYSVFECELLPRETEKALCRLRRIVDPDEDALRVYPLCAACAQRPVDLAQPGPVPFHQPKFYVA